jgi:hypothetical protein
MKQEKRLDFFCKLNNSNEIQDYKSKIPSDRTYSEAGVIPSSLSETLV